MIQHLLPRTVSLLGLVALSLSAVFAPVAQAAPDAWPSRPIHLVVPFPAGSSPDIVARTIAEPLGKTLGQSIIVENKPGAGGNIGTRFVSMSKPDGYTLLNTINGPLVTAPTLYKKTLGYDPLKDLAPITLVATSPNVLTVPADSPVNSVQDFVKYARAQAGKLNYGSVGPGSASHLAMERFKHDAGIELAHIPYPGFPQVISAIIGGNVQAAFMVPAIAMPQVRGRKVKALAVTSLQPSPELPGIPIMASQGFPGFEATSWVAMLAPAGTPAPIVDRLNKELTRIIDSPEVRKQLALQYYTAAPSTPAELTRRIVDEKARWDPVISRLNLSLD